MTSKIRLLIPSKFLGTWYGLAHIPELTASEFNCLVSVNSMENGTIYYERYWLNKRLGQVERDYGYLLIQGSTTYIVHIYPIEFTIEAKTMVISDDYFVTYSCSECGFYGKQDAGVKSRIWTKLPAPNCLVTDKIWQQLAKKEIPKSAYTLIPNEECQLVYDYVKEFGGKNRNVTVG